MSQTLCCFFFNDTATTEIYTLSLHDALPIFRARVFSAASAAAVPNRIRSPRSPCFSAARAGIGISPNPSGWCRARDHLSHPRSEEHTSELQSRQYLVCRLLLEKKKTTIYTSF